MNTLNSLSVQHTPKGIRTPVASVKGRCPRPLDDGGEAVFETPLFRAPDEITGPKDPPSRQWSDRCLDWAGPVLARPEQ